LNSFIHCYIPFYYYNASPLKIVTPQIVALLFISMTLSGQAGFIATKYFLSPSITNFLNTA